MACMFTMMNRARLAVGLQGVGVAECATQQALAYARERRQGRTTGMKATESAPIIAHPDVRRMLLSMRALTGAARAICYATAIALDRSERSADEAARKTAHERASLLTPVAKAFSTDVGNEVASLNVQVHGGMGFIEETGAAQLYRDARIAAIYEGTNGIQAIDLVTRKLPLSGGATVAAHIKELRGIVEALDASNDPAFGWTPVRLARGRRKPCRAPPTGCSAVAKRMPTRRLPARRPICGCSGLPPAAVCWRKQALAAHAARRRGGARASRWRGSLPRTSRFKPAVLNAPSSKARRACSAPTPRSRALFHGSRTATAREAQMMGFAHAQPILHWHECPRC